MNTSNRFGIETVARQHQKEISNELATRHLLKESKPSTLGLISSRRIVLHYSATIIILTLILLHFFH